MAVLALSIVSAALAYAQTGGGYDLSWSTVDGGGGTFSSGGIYSVGGTAGQPDASAQGSMSGGIFAVQGGFWSAPASKMLVGHVVWQGASAQPHVRQQQPVTLTLKLGTTEVNYPSQTTDASGFFTVEVTNLASGIYSWRVKGPRFLATSGSVNLSGAAQTSSDMGLQLTGDANNNNIVNSVDFNLLRAAFGTTLDPRTDFNNDGITNSVDFNLLRGNFGIGGAPPVGPGQP
jgi:hypothetical protein